MTVEVVRSQPSDAATLTAIAFAAKRYWGYPEAWMQRWAATLTVTPGYLVNHPCFSAVEKGAIVGWAGLRIENEVDWIEHLWVRPDAMGRGIGRMLFDRCEEEALRLGGTRLLIEADPHAAPFYVRMGAQEIRRKAALMDGVERFLSIMEKRLI